MEISQQKFCMTAESISSVEVSHDLVNMSNHTRTAMLSRPKVGVTGFINLQFCCLSELYSGIHTDFCSSPVTTFCISLMHFTSLHIIADYNDIHCFIAGDVCTCFIMKVGCHRNYSQTFSTKIGRRYLAAVIRYLASLTSIKKSGE